MGLMKNLNVQKILGGGPRVRGVNFAVTSYFFDAPKIVNSVDRATRKVLSRFGSYVRRTMRSSIRKRKKTSDPGKPPTSRVGLLKQFIFFSYDPNTKSVVIGPERLNAKIGNTPEVLEYGGTNTVATYRRRGFKRGEQYTRTRVVEKKRVQVKARPFAHPALKQELPTLAPMWKASVKP